MPIEDDGVIREILQNARTIAVIGASEKPWRDSHWITKYLREQGYRVYAVNPQYESVLGERCYSNLRAVPETIDIVDVFRNSSGVPPLVEEALAAASRILWLQLGVIHEEAARHAEEHGLRVIMDRCIAVDHRRLIGEGRV